MKKYIKLFEEFIEPNYIYDEEGFINDIEQAKKWLWENIQLENKFEPDAYVDDYGDEEDAASYVEGVHYYGDGYRVDNIIEYNDNLEFIYEDGKLICNILAATGGSTKMQYDRSRVRLGHSNNFYIINNMNICTLYGMPRNISAKYEVSNCPNIITMEYSPEFGIESDDSTIVLENIISYAPFDDSEVNIIGTVEERADRFIEWLPKSPNIINSLIWVKEYVPKVFEALLKNINFMNYIKNINTEGVISDDVKDIASTALKSNHKLR